MDNLQALIDELSRDFEHGTLYLTIKKYDRHITSIDINSVASYKTAGGNVEAMTMMGTLLKQVSQAIKQNPTSTPPNLTFTIFYGKNGEVERVNVNDFKRKRLN